MALVGDRGPACEQCGGRSTRGVRTRKLILLDEPICYLTYLWSCSVCGHDWVDDALEHLNGCAEQAAHASARRAS